jgi:hypothetical protein
LFFSHCLVDSDIVTPARPELLWGYIKRPAALHDHKATTKLFAWLTRTFNGHMFLPPPPRRHIGHLGRLADFLEAADPTTAQVLGSANGRTCRTAVPTA